MFMKRERWKLLKIKTMMEIVNGQVLNTECLYRLFMGVNVKCLRVGQLIRAVWRAFVILQTL